MANASTPSVVRVWDLPTRVFHWLLAVTVLGSLTTAWLDAMVWHIRCGLTVMALLLFRIVWGLVGGRWSRFTSFVYGPPTVLRYLRGQIREGDHFEVGHNPLGSFSVFGMLGFLAVQVATGLVADDEISVQGPLNRYVANAKALAATSWHKDFGQWILLTLVVLHVAAIVYYLVRKKNNLVRPMLSGDKPMPADSPTIPASSDSLATRGLALAVGAFCAAVAIWVGRLGS